MNQQFFKKINVVLTNDIVCIKVSTALKNTTPSKTPPFSFLPSSPLKSANCPCSLFRQSPLYIGFSWTPLKVTKFLVKICQFEFLVMTEKNIFVYNFFLSLNISDFSGVFCKIATPWKRLAPLFQQPPLKVEVLSNPPFWKFGRRFNPPSRKAGVHTMIMFTLI